MKRILLLLLINIMLINCVACNNKYENENMTQKETEEEAFIIIIPESFFDFTNSQAEDTVKGYEDYCIEAKVENKSVVLELTEEQKNNLVNVNNQFIEETLEEFVNENPLYAYELSGDYKQVVYKYDEKIDMYVQGKILSGVTSMYALNGILETGNSDWNIEIVVKNCHTDNVVAKGTVPEGGLKFDQKEWEESYNEQ